jgi:hypothetical protein
MQIKTLYARHNGLCFYCGHRTFHEVGRRKVSPARATRDHLRGRSQGGKNGSNVVLACARCNSLRGLLPPEKFACIAKHLPPPVKYLRGKERKALLALLSEPVVLVEILASDVMPIPPDAAAPAPDLLTRARDWLRDRPNPFDGLVRPQRPDEHFLDHHEPSVHRTEFEKLLAVVDAYRTPGYRLSAHRPASKLHDSRVVTVLGPRGAGKTHLLDALAYRADRRQLLVRPAYFEPHVLFEDALLGHLVHALLAPDVVTCRPPYRDIAANLTARLLRQALKASEAAEPLAADLGRADHAADLVELLRRHGREPAELAALVEQYLRRWQRDGDALHALRGQLFQALVRDVLLEEADALGHFLESVPVPAGRPYHRGEVARQLLLALVEMAALVQWPVVFAFDNLEGLLAPQGQLSSERLRAFLDGLAQAVDTTRGVLFLLFAESELYRALRSEGHPFALSRLDQGVALPGHALVDVIEIGPLAPDALRNLIERRVARALQGFADAGQLPRLFPFTAAALAAVEQMAGAPLRTTLQRVRELYTRTVHPQAPTVQPPPAPDIGAELERVWQEQWNMAGQRVGQGVSSAQGHDLNAGLGQLLQAAIGVEQDGWRLAGAAAALTKYPRLEYAEVTAVDWHRVSAGNGDHGQSLRVTVGFLLATRRGMAGELEAKCAPLPEPLRQADGLIVLWPVTANKVLPAVTGQAWDKIRPQQSSLRHLDDDHLRLLLAAAGWAEAARTQVPAATADAIRHHLARQCAPLLPLVVPPETWKHAAAAPAVEAKAGAE